MNVLASPLVPNSPLTPKSQSFTWPLRHSKMLDGLISAQPSVTGTDHSDSLGVQGTSMDDLPAVEVCQTVQDSFSNLAQDLLACPSAQLLYLSVDAIQAAPLAKLHGDRYCASRFVHKRTVVTANML